MAFLVCIENRGYIARVAEIISQDVDVSQSTLPAASVDFLALDKPFDRMYVYSHLDYWVKQIISDRRLRARSNRCCFISWHCVDVYVVSLLICSTLFVPVPDYLCSDECSRLSFVQMPINAVYYSNLITSRRAPELGNRITISEICVCAPFFLF